MLQLSVECHYCRSWWEIESSTKAVAEDRQIMCPHCRKNLHLFQALLDFFLTDNAFVSHELRGSWHEGGNLRIQVGQTARVLFETRPARVFEVILFTYPRVTGLRLAPSNITTNGFTIVSSMEPDRRITRTEVSWNAFGATQRRGFLPWKEALADAKGYEIQRDSNMQVVAAETAFELFMDNFLSTRLKLKPRTKRWVLKRSIDEKLSVWYAEARGRSLPIEFKEEYSEWQTAAKEVRDSIVHRRYQTNLREGKEAFKAVLRLITRIDPSWLGELRWSVGATMHGHKFRSNSLETYVRVR